MSKRPYIQPNIGDLPSAPELQVIARAAKFDLWKLLDLWTLEAAMQLLSGLEPIRGFENLVNSNRLSIPKDVARRVLYRLMVAETAIRAGALPDEHPNQHNIQLKEFLPVTILKWASGKGFEVPVELSSLMDQAEEDVGVETVSEKLSNTLSQQTTKGKRKTNLRLAIEKAIDSIGKKNATAQKVFDHLENNDSTGYIEDSTSETIIWRTTKGTLKETTFKTIANTTSNILKGR